MTISKTDAGAAAELIAKGLSPKLRPAGDSRYQHLLDRHRSDPDFRELVEEIGAGLGLAVLDAGLSGIVLGPEEGSVFALRLSDYRKDMSVPERLLHGLVHLGIAAWCYPTPASLLDEDVRRVSVNAIEKFLRRASERLREECAGEDPDADQSEFEKAWRRYLSIPATRKTGSGRAVANTTTRRIAYAMERLADQGLLRKESKEDGGTFKALDRYRIQVRELAATPVWRMFASAADGEEDPCSS